MNRRSARLRSLVLASSLLVIGCGNKTYVALSLLAGPAMPANVQRIDLDLTLGGNRASAKLGGSEAISLPSTAVLVIANGEGELAIHALALDAAEQVLAEGTTRVDVIRGQTVSATISFGEDITLDGGADAGIDAGDPRCSVCDPKAACDVSGGMAVCTCPAGYTGDGKTCTDANECTATPAVCDPNATCTNQPGAYTCACKVGFTGDGKTCKANWTLVTEVANASLNNHAYVIGTPNNVLYMGNEIGTASAKIWKSVSLASGAGAPVDLPVMPNPDEWCFCGGNGNTQFVLEGPRLWVWGGGLRSFNTTSAVWTNYAATWPAGFYSGAGAFLNGTMYILGGWDTMYNPIKKIRQFPILNGDAGPVVDSAAMLPVALNGGIAAAASGKIFYMGGETLLAGNTVPNKKIYAFDPAGPTVSEVGMVPFSFRNTRPALPGTVYNAKIWTFDSGELLHAYDPSTNTWSAPAIAAPFPGPNSGDGWLAVVAGTPQALYALNYLVDAVAGTTKVIVYRYNLE